MSIRCLKSDGTAACGFVQHSDGDEPRKLFDKLEICGFFDRVFEDYHVVCFLFRGRSSLASRIKCSAQAI